MLYVISGAIASGKTTTAKAVAERLPDLVARDVDERPHAAAGGRLDDLEIWIEEAIEIEAEGGDLVFSTQSPLGEVLASPRATELEGIAPCLLDCHDFARLERWYGRGVDVERGVGMDHLCWAVFHRLHARDPQWEQRVLLDPEHDGSVWSRWTSWRKDDPRWSVFTYDSTDSDLGMTIAAVERWIVSIRERGAPLRRADEWWS